MAIKNDSYIAKLSQDHHLEVLFCDRVETGIKHGVSLDRIKEYVAYFWHHHLEKHFIEEEQLVLNKIDDVFCAKGKQDHLSIINEIENIISGVSNGQHDFLHLVSSVNQHVNFEERVLFPHLELLLPQEELQYIQQRLTDSHRDSCEGDFSDKFWAVQKNET